MNTLELRTAFIKEAGEIIAADDHTVQKALNYLRRIREQIAKDENEKPKTYTIEETNARIKQSLEEAKTGQFISDDEMKHRTDEFIKTYYK